MGANKKAVELTGRVFHRWTVLGKKEESGPRRSVKWKCACACGNIGYVDGYDLLNERSKQCSSCSFATIVSERTITWRGKTMLQKEWCHLLGIPSSTLWYRIARTGSVREALTRGVNPDVLDAIGPDTTDPVINEPNILDLTGDRYGNVVITGLARDEARGRVWHGQCDCGGTVTGTTYAFKRGRVKRCKACQVHHTPEHIKVTWGTHNMTLARWCESLGLDPKETLRRIDSGWSVRKALTHKVDPALRFLVDGMTTEPVLRTLSPRRKRVSRGGVD